MEGAQVAWVTRDRRRHSVSIAGSGQIAAYRGKRIHTWRAGKLTGVHHVGWERRRKLVIHLLQPVLVHRRDGGRPVVGVRPHKLHIARGRERGRHQPVQAEADDRAAYLGHIDGMRAGGRGELRSE